MTLDEIRTAPRVLFTMRTADRSPKPNYIARTVKSLLAGGVERAQIHVFPTHPDVRLMPVPDGVIVHVPARPLTANENGLAPIALLDRIDADWIILSEDDLEWCDRPIYRMAEWLDAYADPDVLVHRFFAFDRLKWTGMNFATAPLREQKGSQVIALRADDAKRFATWAKAHPKNWRPKGSPFQGHKDDGFDKLVGYWALQDRPAVTHGLVSVPFFVRHIGKESSLHSRGRILPASMSLPVAEVRA